MESIALNHIFAIQLFAFMALLSLNLFAEKWFKQSPWGGIAWLGCILLLALHSFTSNIVLGVFSGGFAFISAALLADAYGRRRAMKGLK